MSDRLSISVVIPTYNCEQYIAEAVQSALNQVAMEVIVVDDGSTDNTYQAIERLANPRLRYVHQQNQGVSAARNHGIYIARGELVAFLDADDYFLPHKLSQQKSIFAANPDLGLVQSGWQRVDDLGRSIATVALWESATELTVETWLRFKPVLPSALMIKRDWLIRVDGFDPQLRAAEDVDLVSRLALNGCQSAWLKEIAVSYRQRSNSAMGNSLVQAQDLSKFLNKFFQQPDLPESVQLLEASVRYHTMVWAAWYLHHTGCTEEMTHCLQVAWQHSPYLPLEALIHWVESFSEFSQQWGQPLEIVELIQSSAWQQLVQWLLRQK